MKSKYIIVKVEKRNWYEVDFKSISIDLIKLTYKVMFASNYIF